MHLLLAVAALFGIGFVLSLGCFLAMKGYSFALISIVLVWAFGFVKLGLFLLKTRTDKP